jgi:hypothetical protein
MVIRPYRLVTFATAGIVPERRTPRKGPTVAHGIELGDVARRESKNDHDRNDLHRTAAPDRR